MGFPQFDDSQFGNFDIIWEFTFWLVIKLIKKLRKIFWFGRKLAMSTVRTIEYSEKFNVHWTNSKTIYKEIH